MITFKTKNHLLNLSISKRLLDGKKSENKSGQWVNTVVEAGTIRDKVNGLVLLVQQSPFHRIATLDQLLGLALSTTTRIAILAIESIKNLFFASYLPENKLSYFSSHFESISEDEAEKIGVQDLVRWYYEDAIKLRYTTFIQALEKAAHSSLRESKTVAIGTLQRMLIEKPEQEQTILALLVDKMGDPHSKTANWAVNLLLGVLEQHPNMKLVVAKEVQLFINKHTPLTTTTPLSLLSHIALAKGEEELANMLVATYLRQLKVISEQKILKRKKGSKDKKKKKTAKKQKEVVAEPTPSDEASQDAVEGSQDTKMASVLLTGVNRAFPYAKLPQDVYESHLEILFSLVEYGGFNRKILSLAVIFKVIKLQQEATDNLDTTNRTRFYHLLYDLLLSAELASGFGQPNYKQAFFNLVEGAIAADKDIARARAFVKRLLVMAANARPGFACSALILASKLFQTNATLPSMVSTCTKPNTPKNVKPDPKFQDEGNNSCLWELCALRTHFHPLVARWAQLLSSNSPVLYNGNPLDDLNLNTFLSRFQNKQPSTKQRIKGKAREMQPRKGPTPSATFSFTVKDFQTKKESEIRPDELYFFKYLQIKIAMLEREERETPGHKKKRDAKGQISAEALEGLLEVEAEDDDFGLDGAGLVDEEGASDEEDSEALGILNKKRGEKRKARPAKKEKEAKKKAPQKPQKAKKLTKREKSRLKAKPKKGSAKPKAKANKSFKRQKTK